MNDLFDYLVKNKEWIFSGIGVFIITSVIATLKFIKKKHNTITIYQELDEIRALNNFETTIEINMCSICFNDIFSKPDLKRKDSSLLYTNKQKPVKPNESITLFKIDSTLIGLAQDYLKHEKEAFSSQYPNMIYPYTLGITIRIDYSRVDKGKVKRIVVKRLFSGNLIHGYSISKLPYGKDSYIPQNYLFKEKLTNFFFAIKHPFAWYKHRKSMQLAQAKLDYAGIQRALFYKRITDEDAIKRLNKIKRKLNRKQLEDFILYINEK